MLVKYTSNKMHCITLQEREALLIRGRTATPCVVVATVVANTI